jgi:hypothetical protein
MERMYYGLDWAKQVNVQLGGGYVPNVLISASVLWNPRDRRFQRLHTPRHDSLFLDSGGYGFHRSYGEYPFPRERYVKLAKEVGADLVAVMDYPCERGVNRSMHSDNVDRVAATTDSARALMRSHPEITWVPVIQGYDAEEYANCVSRYESMGLIRPFMAVGSLCTRKTAATTRAVLRVIRRHLPDVRLHGFGVDLRLLKDREIRSILWSADTAAWKYNVGPGSEGRRYPTNAQKPGNFVTYAAKVTRILSPKGPRIESFGGV